MPAILPAPRIATLAVAALLLLACDAAPPTAPASSATIAPSLSRNGVAQRFDVAFALTDGCAGEVVDFAGEITLVSSVHEDSGGGYHWRQNYVIHGTAVGRSSGARYVYNETHNMKENGDLPFDGLFDATGAYYFTMSFISTLVSQGPAPNEIWQWDIRYKLDRAGVVTMQEVRIESVCRG